jgi:hypothetical protein
MQPSQRDPFRAKHVKTVKLITIYVYVTLDGNLVKIIINIRVTAKTAHVETN